MDEKKILSNLADNLVDEKTRMKIDILEAGFFERLAIKMRLKKAYREFEIRPMVLGKMVQISKLMLSFEPGSVEYDGGVHPIIKLATVHGESLARIIAICVHPGRKVPESLVQFFLDNLQLADLQKAAAIVLSKLEIQNFLLSIITLNGIQILKKESKSVVSLNTKKEEIIASTGQ
jgi:hypothetical protein